MPSRLNAAPSPPPLGTLIDDGALELVEVLGYGGYGVVYRAIDTRSCDNTSFAVKCLMRAHMHENSRQRQVHLREITLHQRASDHPNVVTLHRVIEDNDYTFIVMDYCSDGDLFSQILNNRRYLGREKVIKRVFLQLLDAVEYCHSIGIYHRDLKPENVLCFDGGLRLAITDFGLATTDAVSDEFRTGSVYHMSPECKGGCFAPTGTYSPMCNDVWSLGIILLNIITGRNPWRSASETDPTFRAYLQNPNGFLPTVLPISCEVNALLVRTLEVDWRKRITLQELRRAVKTVHSFYSEDVVFQGSMARCPWEADIDIENDESPEEDISDGKFVSHWSQDTDSEMVFATASQVESPWTEFSATGTSSTWVEESFVRSTSPSPTSSRRLRAALRTPPSTHSMSSPVGSIPSLPITPRSSDTELPDSFESIQIPSKPALTINTAYGRTDHDDVASAMVSPGSSAMQTAIENAEFWESMDSSCYITSATSPSKNSTIMSSAVDLGMDMMIDDEDVIDTWTYSTTDATDSVAYMSTTSLGERSSVTGLDLNFDSNCSDTVPDEHVSQDSKPTICIRYPPSERTLSVFLFPSSTKCDPFTSSQSSKKSREGKSRSKGSSLFSPLKSAFLRSFSPNTFTASTPRRQKHRSLSPGSMFSATSPSSSGLHPMSSPPTRSSNFLLSPMLTSPTSPPMTTAISSSIDHRQGRGLHKRRHWFSPGKLFTAACAS